MGCGECADLACDASAHRVIPGGVEHVRDPPSDSFHLGLFHPARRKRRRPDADAGGDLGGTRVVRDGVLVDGDPDGFEGFLGLGAGDVLVAQIDEEEMTVGSAGDQFVAAFDENLAEAPGVSDDLLLVGPEFGPKRLAEGDGLGEDDMAERPALKAGKHRPVEFVGVLAFA